MPDFSDRRTWWILGGAVVSAILVTLNVLSDMGDVDATPLELVLDSVETILMVAGAGGVGMLLDSMRVERREKIILRDNLAVARAEGETWRTRVQSQLAGLASEIDRQFDTWLLTGAEREVGMLMLKGLSHKETASVRGTSEATVRQQARSVFQKSKLPGKAAFSAYFLEDLLPPSQLIGPSKHTGNGAREATANEARGKSSGAYASRVAWPAPGQGD